MSGGAGCLSTITSRRQHGSFSILHYLQYISGAMKTSPAQPPAIKGHLSFAFPTRGIDYVLGDWSLAQLVTPFQTR